LSVPAKTISYGDEDGLEIIGRVIPNNPEVILFVTDDESRPWPAFKGHLSNILTLIGEVRFFEYILTDEKLDWLVFDTHYNALVLTEKLIE